jgi:cytochrome c-type biogenesis protein CcmF
MRDIAHKLRWAALAAVVLAVAVPLLMGRWSAMVFLGLFLAFWLIITTLSGLRTRLAGAGGGSLGKGMRAVPSAYYGMVLAHLGVAVFILGVTVSRGYETESDVKMNIGDTAQLGGFTFRLDAINGVSGPNYQAARASVEVLRDGARVTTLHPEKRLYTVQNMPMTEAAIDAGVWRHLYVSLGEEVEARAWTLRIYHKPLISWIWAGCLIMALGGALAALDRRYRVKSRSAAAEPGTASPALSS